MQEAEMEYLRNKEAYEDNDRNDAWARAERGEE